MPANTKTSYASCNVQADAMGASLNNGYLKLYGGEQPEDADTATSETVIATLRFGAEAFDAAVDGVITAKALTADTNAAGGTATWFRTYRSDGTTGGWDGSVGTNDEDLVLETNVIPASAHVDVTDLTYTVPRG